MEGRFIIVFTFHIFAWIVSINTKESSVGDWLFILAGIVTILVATMNIFVYKFYLHINLRTSVLNGKKKLSYNDWAGALTTAGTFLSIILALQTSQAATSLSLISGGIIVTVPLVYSTFAQSYAYLWFFLTMTSVSLVAVLAQLMAAFILVGSITSLSSVELSILQFLVLCTFVVAIIYDVKTNMRIVQPDYQERLAKRRSEAASKLSLRNEH